MQNGGVGGIGMECRQEWNTGDIYGIQEIYKWNTGDFTWNTEDIYGIQEIYMEYRIGIEYK